MQQSACSAYRMPTWLCTQKEDDDIAMEILKGTKVDKTIEAYHGEVWKADVDNVSLVALIRSG